MVNMTLLYMYSTDIVTCTAAEQHSTRNTLLTERVG